MLNNFGIYLQYSPRESIRAHGISRAMAFLIKGMLRDKDARVTIAAPSWFKQEIMGLLEDIQIDKNRVELLCPRKTNFFKLYDIAQKFKVKIKSYLSPKEGVTAERFTLIKNLLSLVFSGNSFLGSLFLCFSIVMGIILSPLILAFLILSKFFRKTSARILPKIKQFIRYCLRYLTTIAIVIYYRVAAKERVNLIKMVNKSKIRTWYIPTIAWHDAINIQATKIFCVPDLLFFDFPSYYSKPHFQQILLNVSKLFSSNCHLVCYSDYVKQNHILNKFSLPESKVSVIKHGVMTQSEYLNIDHYFPAHEYKHNALRILSKYIKENIEWPYLRDFDFSDTPFIFYSSQVRYHKNYFNLIKAFEILLRERFNRIKLIVTGDLYRAQEAEDIKNYILEKKLQYDIISLSHLPSQVLAALNALALVAVNPTLFEGGFPFTFTEAYSVGTPSVMSSIPVVVDEIEEGQLKNTMLFDPYNIDDMVNKIEWALQHSDELYSLQKPLYEKFEKRSWEHVANDYLKVFKEVVNNES